MAPGHGRALPGGGGSAASRARPSLGPGDSALQAFAANVPKGRGERIYITSHLGSTHTCHMSPQASPELPGSADSVLKFLV